MRIMRGALQAIAILRSVQYTLLRNVCIFTQRCGVYILHAGRTYASSRGSRESVLHGDNLSSRATARIADNTPSWFPRDDLET